MHIHRTRSTSHVLNRALLIFIAGLTFLSCNDDNDNEPSGVEIRPEGENPAWAPDIDPEMLAVIERLDKLNSTPLNEMSVEAARNAPTPKDAVEALIRARICVPAVKGRLQYDTRIELND